MLDETSKIQYLEDDFAPSSPVGVHQHAAEATAPVRRERRMRVLPLAIGAVIATVLVAGLVRAVLWDASGHRYAAEILNIEL